MTNRGSATLGVEKEFLLPRAWVIPRLQGRAKAALVAVEFDEFGGGRGEDMHSRLSADLLDAAER